MDTWYPLAVSRDAPSTWVLVVEHQVSSYLLHGKTIAWTTFHVVDGQYELS